MYTMKEVNQVKDEIQQQAHAIWTAAGRRGTVSAGTGFGKSRIAVMEANRMFMDGSLPSMNSILLVTPTEKLRDENWPKEFADWEADYLLDRRYVKLICYASLKNEKGNHYKLVILDEVHRLTDLAAEAFKNGEDDALTTFFSENLADAVLGLTATVPDSKREPDKVRIISQVAPVVFNYSLDQGVEDGMIADYEIRVIMHTLDAKEKYIPGGTKAKPFLTTEASHYEYLEKQIRRHRMLVAQAPPAKKASMEKLAMFKTFDRNRFLYNLKSKTELARRCMKHMLGDKRTLVFCGSIEQAELLLPGATYHSKSGSEAYSAFNAKKINTLAAVQAVDEGVNIVDLDQLLIVGFDSSDRRLTQRIGRSLRLRPGHKAMIIILCTQGTAEEKWLEKAIKGFDPAKISYYSSKNVPA
ncbi:MAG: hypothetical protein EO766_13210 [Hydrotalea sp. AMD]|nr:MAG: hypothetical protein EO766_13210 [Hydrotalea sp. AMD]